MPGMVAPLVDYPDFNAKERKRIGTLLNSIAHLEELEPDKESVKARLAAYKWALDAIVADEENEDHIDQLMFYTLRDWRNVLENLPDEEMNGFRGSELRAVDWIMEELIPGSGHYAHKRKLKLWMVEPERFESCMYKTGIVVAETAEEAVAIVARSKDFIRYANGELMSVHIPLDTELAAKEISFRKGLVFHTNEVDY